MQWSGFDAGPPGLENDYEYSGPDSMRGPAGLENDYEYSGPDSMRGPPGLDNDYEYSVPDSMRALPGSKMTTNAVFRIRLGPSRARK